MRIRGTSGLVVLAWLGGGPATAADLPVPAETVEIVQPTVESAWSFSITPYVWGAGISGDVGVFGLPTVDVDASFSEIFDHLDFGAMLASELRYGRFGIATDLVFVKLSGTEGTPFGILARSASVDVETLAFTAAGEYRLVEGPAGSLDLMAGARLWSVDTTVSVEGGLLGSRERSDGESWVDPLVGAKGRFDLSPKFYLTGAAMVGGFGVASDFMWDVWGGGGYQFNKHIAAVVGYRGMGVDFEHDGFVYDVVQHGPVIGAAIHF